MEITSECYKLNFRLNVTISNIIFYKLPKSLTFDRTNAENKIVSKKKTNPMSLGQKLKKLLASESWKIFFENFLNFSELHLSILCSPMKAKWFKLHTLTFQDHTSRQVRECVYLGVVLMDNLACTSDVERWKRTLFDEQNSVYQKISYVDTYVLLYLFRVHAITFYGIESCFLKSHRNDVNNVSVVHRKAIKPICGRNSYVSNDELLSVLV